jgi:hypothetical protein
MSTNIGYQILQAVRRRVGELNLDDVRDIQLQTKPLDESQIRPGAYITPPTKGNGEWATFPAKTNERQVVGYGCQITVVHGTFGEWNGDPSQVTDWQQAVRRKFHDRRTDFDTYEVQDAGFNCWGPCKVTPAEFLMELQDERHERFDITALVVRVFVIEPRGG